MVVGGYATSRVSQKPRISDGQRDESFVFSTRCSSIHDVILGSCWKIKSVRRGNSMNHQIKAKQDSAVYLLKLNGRYKNGLLS